MSAARPALSTQEHIRVPDKELCKLKEHSMTGIGVDDQLCIREVLLQIIGIYGVEDDVSLPADYEDGHANISQVSKAFALRLTPFLKCSKLQA